nr:MAG TPA: hypothetical protein [Caudoviricetes sp.]
MRTKSFRYIDFLLEDKLIFLILNISLLRF